MHENRRIQPKGEYILELNENTCTQTRTHTRWFRTKRLQSLSYQIIQDGDRKIKHAHLHRLSQGFMQTEQRLGLHLPRWRECRLLSRRLLHIRGMLLPLVRSHWYTTPSLPLSLSLSIVPFPEWVAQALSLSLYFSVLVYTQHKKELAAAVTNTLLPSTSLALEDGKKSEELDLLPVLPFAHCLSF